MTMASAAKTKDPEKLLEKGTKMKEKPRALKILRVIVNSVKIFYLKNLVQIKKFPEVVENKESYLYFK